MRSSYASVAALFVLALGAGSTSAETVTPPVQDCDRLAADSLDTDAVAPPVSTPLFNAAEAVRVCTTTLTKFPDVARFQYQLGRAWQWTGRNPDAIEEYKKAAAQGYSVAMAHLGIAYQIIDLSLKGGNNAVPYNPGEAIQWLSAAAEKGSPLGQYYLGALHMFDAGQLHKDTTEAAKWFQKALSWFQPRAEQGEPDAQMILGNMYRRGYGVTLDDNEAVR